MCLLHNKLDKKLFLQSTSLRQFDIIVSKTKPQIPREKTQGNVFTFSLRIASKQKKSKDEKK
jgi:hypothetical protein